MIVIPDLETVVKGLELCTRPVTRGCTVSPGLCPYEHNGCRTHMEMDALILLKGLSGLSVEAAMEDMERHDGFVRWNNG